MVASAVQDPLMSCMNHKNAPCSGLVARRRRQLTTFCDQRHLEAIKRGVPRDRECALSKGKTYRASGGRSHRDIQQAIGLRSITFTQSDVRYQKKPLEMPRDWRRTLTSNARRKFHRPSFQREALHGVASSISAVPACSFSRGTASLKVELLCEPNHQQRKSNQKEKETRVCVVVPVTHFRSATS
jgi:hypothetical protein